MKRALALFLVLTLFQGSLAFPVKSVNDMVITDLDNNTADDYVFGCLKIVSDPWDRGGLYVYENAKLKWYYHLSSMIRAVAAYDLNSDGKKEVIAACDILVDKGYVYVFDSDGNLKWRRGVPGTAKMVCCYENKLAVHTYGQGERVIIFDSEGRKLKDLPVSGDISKFEIKDLDNDGDYEMVTAGTADNKWEHFLVVYDLQGKVLWNYETPEHINDFQFHDIDGDGTLETILGVYDAVYVTKGGTLSGKVGIPPAVLHVRILGDQLLVVNENTMFLIKASDVLNLNGGSVPVTEFFQLVNSTLNIAVKPKFLFLKDMDADEVDEILVGNGEIFEVHKATEFGPPQLWAVGTAARRPAVTYLVYENLTHNVKMNYPRNWTINDQLEAPGVVVFTEPQGTAFVDIAITDVTGRATLEEMTQATIEDRKKNVPDFNLLEEGPTTLLKNPAYKIVYTQTVEQVTAKTMEIWTLKDNKGYTVTYSARIDRYSNFIEIAQEMVNSFAFIVEKPEITICQVQLDPPGEDNANLNEEWVKICNEGEKDIDMTGWTLLNDVGAYYQFPDGFVLKAGASVIVHTGSGQNTETDLYWGNPVEVWNNAGDTVTLQDDKGNTVVEHTWTPT